MLILLIDRKQQAGASMAEFHRDRDILTHINSECSRAEMPGNQTTVSGLRNERIGDNPGVQAFVVRMGPPAVIARSLLESTVGNRFPIYPDIVEIIGGRHSLALFPNMADAQTDGNSSIGLGDKCEFSGRPLLGAGKFANQHFVCIYPDPVGIVFPDAVLFLKGER